MKTIAMKFKLRAHAEYEDEYLGVLPRSFNSIDEAVLYAKLKNAVADTYLVENLPDEENIIISMQEIVDVIETGEVIEDLSFF